MFSIISSLRRRWEASEVILMYHRVAETDFDPWGLCVSPTNFAEQLAVLRRLGCSFSRLSEGRQFRPRSVTVTFDDGYIDAFSFAKPLLERYEVPASFFIISGAVGDGEEFWWDHLERLILSPARLPDTLRFADGKTCLWPTKQRTRQRLYFDIWKVFSVLPVEERLAALQQLEAQIEEPLRPRATRLPMSREQVAELGRSPIFEVGSHTIDHAMLARLSPTEQQRQIESSKKELEAILGRPVDTFSYPHGSHSAQAAEFLRGAGYRLACTSDDGNVRQQSDRYLLPRRMVRNWDGRQFERAMRRYFC